MMRLAQRGYVIVTINYRLEADTKGNDWVKQQMIYDAVDDARAAIRFVRKNAEAWKIDTDRISIMGESAGAITSLFLGYVKAAQKEGNSGNPGYSSQVAAIVSISGELKSQAFCKSVHPWPRDCAINEIQVDHVGDMTGKN